MLFERFEDTDLSQYSYAVGCPRAGELAIVDPRRDVDVYLDFAHRHGLRITRVLETHIHADFASGARELAERTGAELAVSGYDRGETFEVRFPHRDLREGDAVELGSVRIEPLHTPGHTPEHLAFLVFDGARSREVPMLALTGDFLFVGSVGRPDLLGEEAKRGLAERFYASVRDKLGALPEGIEVHPAHGAGSMCGAGMSGRPMSTLGFERAANPYLDPGLSQERFVERLLASAPPFPPYYRRMKRINSEGPRLLGGLPGGLPGLGPIPVDRFAARLATGEPVVVDLRDYLAFGGAHVPGSFGIGLGGNLATWAAWAVPYDRPILLVGDGEGGEGGENGAGGGGGDREAVERAVRALVRVGLDDVEGYLDGGIEAWQQAGLPLAGGPPPAR
jgi:hydroxyacylglutathione hydrolase